MELNELKSGWKNMGNQLRSEDELEKMTKMFNHPVIKRIKTKLVVQMSVLLFLLFVYHDWFDGYKKPFYANLALVLGVVLYLINDIIGYISLVKPVGQDSLKKSVTDYLIRVKRLSSFSVIITLLYSCAILIFFTSTILFTKEKALVLVFSAVIVFQLIILSSRIWSGWIKKLKQQISDFNLDEEG